MACIETHNGHAGLIEKHKALLAEAEAQAEAAVQEFLQVQAQYLACKAEEKAASKLAGKCCKTVLKKIGAVGFFVYDCATEGADAAADNHLWPISELWTEDEVMPTLDDVQLENDGDDSGKLAPYKGSDYSNIEIFKKYNK